MMTGKGTFRKKIPANEAAAIAHMIGLRNAFLPMRSTAKATMAKTAGLRP